MISQTPVQRNFGRVTNAIDMARQPEAWHDFLRLESGRRAREVIVARGQAAASVEGIGAGAGRSSFCAVWPSMRPGSAAGPCRGLSQCLPLLRCRAPP